MKNAHSDRASEPRIGFQTQISSFFSRRLLRGSSEKVAIFARRKLTNRAVPLCLARLESKQSRVVTRVRAFSRTPGADGVADERFTQLLRQGDAKVFKKYSQMKLQIKHEALVKLNRMANEQNSAENSAL